MSKFPRVPSAALLTALTCIACTPFTVLNPDGGGGPPEVGGNSLTDGGADSPAEAATSQDGPTEVISPDARGDASIETTDDAQVEVAVYLDAGFDVADARPAGPPLKNLGLWLTADRGVTLTDGLVSRWEDQSGHGLQVSQNDPAYRPTLLPQAFGDHPAVRYSNDKFLDLGPALSDLTNGLTVLVVSRSLSPPIDDPHAVRVFAFLLARSNTVSGSQVGMQISPDEKGISAVEYFSGDTFVESIIGSGSDWRLIESIHGGGVPGQITECRVRVNGQERGFGACVVPAVTYRAVNFVGASADLTSDMGEMLVYDDADEAVSLQARAYLMAKWGLK